jgi:hypothetical protein
MVSATKSCIRAPSFSTPFVEKSESARTPLARAQGKKMVAAFFPRLYREEGGKMRRTND